MKANILASLSTLATLWAFNDRYPSWWYDALEFITNFAR